MSPTSYQTAPPRVTAFRRSGRDDLTAAAFASRNLHNFFGVSCIPLFWRGFFLGASRMRLLLCLLVAGSAGAGTLPGFRVERVAEVPGFVSSVVADSAGVVYATTTNGWIHRIEG